MDNLYLFCATLKLPVLGSLYVSFDIFCERNVKIFESTYRDRNKTPQDFMKLNEVDADVCPGTEFSK